MQRQVEEGAGRRRTAGTRRPARVLLVDDVMAVRDSFATLLRTAGYAVTAVASGPAALEALEREAVDLLLTDLCMPEMSGWEVVRAVRGRAVTNTHGGPICVGLYSAVLSGISREQLLRAQVDFALTKLTEPEAVRIRPTRRIVRCISNAARHARRSCRSPSKRSSTASPPHLITPAPKSYALERHSVKQSLRIWFISSAPTFPRRERRSVRLVKPETSTNASEPSTCR